MYLGFIFRDFLIIFGTRIKVFRVADIEFYFSLFHIFFNVESGESTILK